MVSPERSIFRVDHKSSRPLVKVGAVLVLGTMAAIFGCGNNEQPQPTSTPPQTATKGSSPTSSPTTEIPPELKCPDGLKPPRPDSSGDFIADRVIFKPTGGITVKIADLIKKNDGCMEGEIEGIGYFKVRVPGESERDSAIADLSTSGDVEYAGKDSPLNSGK